MEDTTKLLRVWECALLFQFNNCLLVYAATCVACGSIVMWLVVCSFAVGKIPRFLYKFLVSSSGR